MQPREVRTPLATSVTLQGKAKQEDAETGGCQMGFPTLNVHWQGAFWLESIPHP